MRNTLRLALGAALLVGTASLSTVARADGYPDKGRAIDQLERRQRRRRGEPTPPMVNVNLSKND